MMDNKWNLTISASPHVRYSETTGRIMADVLIALAPAMAGSVIFFGLRALLVLLVSAAGCVFFEWGYRRLLKKDCTIADGSAAVTGVLLAMACPPTIPFWAVLIGDFFAIVVVKQLFGGIGKNFVNPALAARAFLFSWPVLMSTWAAPQTALSLFGSNADAAKLSGVSVVATVTKAYLVSAFCACVVGFILCAQAGMGNMEAGNVYEMYGVAAGVIGGVSPLGGTGLLLGTFAGAAVWQTLENGLSMIGAPVGIQRIVIGIIVVAAVLLDIVFRRGIGGRKAPAKKEK